MWAKPALAVRGYLVPLLETLVGPVGLHCSRNLRQVPTLSWIGSSTKNGIALALSAVGVVAVFVFGASSSGAKRHAKPPAQSREQVGDACAPARPGVARTSRTCGAKLRDGQAIAPANAPAAIKAVIASANEIDGRPYELGGGHATWTSHGYDCSGSVSYALHGAGLLPAAMVSGEFEGWEASGLGRWITVYANAHHAYMLVAGLRYDTNDDADGVNGPRWHVDLENERGTYVARHPAGL